MHIIKAAGKILVVTAVGLFLVNQALKMVFPAGRGYLGLAG